MTKATRRSREAIEPQYVVVLEVERYVPSSADDVIGSESHRIVGKMIAVPKAFSHERDARYYAKRLSRIDPKQVSQLRRVARKMGLLPKRKKRPSS